MCDIAQYLAISSPPKSRTIDLMVLIFRVDIMNTDSSVKFAARVLLFHLLLRFCLFSVARSLYVCFVRPHTYSRMQRCHHRRGRSRQINEQQQKLKPARLRLKGNEEKTILQ